MIGGCLAAGAVDARFVPGLGHFCRKRLDGGARNRRAIERGFHVHLGQQHRVKHLRNERRRHFLGREYVAAIFVAIALADLHLVCRHPRQRILDVHRRKFALTGKDLHGQLEGIARLRRGRASRHAGQPLGPHRRIGEGETEAGRVFAGHRHQPVARVEHRLDGAVFPGLCPDPVHVRMRGQCLCRFLLRGAVVPVRIVFGDHLDARILVEDMHRAVGVTLIDRVAGNPARQEDLALAFKRVDKRLSAVLAKARGQVADVVGTALGHSGIIHEKQHALFAAALDGAVKRGRRDGEADDRIRALVYHAFVGRDLRLRIGARDHLLEFHHGIVGRGLGQRLDDIGGLGLPRVAGIGQAQVDLELVLRLRAPSQPRDGRGHR